MIVVRSEQFFGLTRLQKASLLLTEASVAEEGVFRLPEKNIRWCHYWNITIYITICKYSEPRTVLTGDVSWRDTDSFLFAVNAF